MAEITYFAKYGWICLKVTWKKWLKTASLQTNVWYKEVWIYMICTSFNNNEGYSLYKVCMNNYFIVIVSIFLHYSKSMSSNLSSLWPSDGKLKQSISTTGCFTLFGRVHNLFLIGRQSPFTSIQPCPMDDGWLYTSGCNWMYKR